MTEKKLLLCIIIAIAAVIGCISIIESIGVRFGDIVFARFLFGLGVFVGIMCLWLAEVFGYIVLKKENKEVVGIND